MDLANPLRPRTILEDHFKIVFHQLEIYKNIHNLRRDSKNNSSLFLNGDYYERIWKPDIYFPAAIDLKRPIIENDDSLELQLDSNGSIMYSMRLIVQTRCNLKLALFPFNQQTCPICISHVSLNYNI